MGIVSEYDNTSQRRGEKTGSSMQQDHKVLTADLRYVPLKELKIGDKLISFEDSVSNKRSRRYLEGTVINIEPKIRPILEVTLESGKTFKVTKDYEWFVKTGSTYRWVKTSSLRKGTCIPKLLPQFDKLNTFEAGWLSGIYDGEGSLCKRRTTGGNCFQLSVSQAQGDVLNLMKKYLESECDVLTTSSLGTNVNKQVENLRIKGGVRDIIKVLGQLRPVRLLSKFSPDDMGRINCPDSLNDKVVSITLCDEDTVIEVEIDCKTAVVDGYGHHTGVSI